MLNYKHDGEQQHLEFSGNLLEIVGEVTFMVKKVHEALKEKDPALAEECKKLVMKIAGDEESPLWLDTKRAAQRLVDKIRKRFDLETE